MRLTEHSKSREGMKKQRGKNVHSESSENRVDTGDSTCRQVFAVLSCFTNSLAGYQNGSFIHASISSELK